MAPCSRLRPACGSMERDGGIAPPLMVKHNVFEEKRMDAVAMAMVDGVVMHEKVDAMLSGATRMDAVAMAMVDGVVMHEKVDAMLSGATHLLYITIYMAAAVDVAAAAAELHGATNRVIYIQ
uniref:Uncharacterized protein n=1 Tax=Oryza punctata TaxID=4537 RepID=A0A0E0L1R4_ORYPU